MNKLLFLAMFLVLGGCAGAGDTKPVEAVASSDGDTEVFCTREKKVGSNMYQRVCKTRRQMDEERAAAEETLRLQKQRTNRSTISNSGVSGG